MNNINEKTKLCISIAANPGNFGANFHNSAFDILDLNWVYIPQRVKSSTDLNRVVNGIRALSIKGCSVSMPHKESVIKYLDELDNFAEKIGAVNTIKLLDDGTLKGYNTDFYGAMKALERVNIKGKKVLLIGAGGVAKAVGLAVKELGGLLTITNKTYKKAKELSNRYNAKLIPWEQANSSFGYLLINATSVGMKSPKAMIVKENAIRNFDVIMDVVIYPAHTKLLKTASKAGKKILPGTLMCVYQAAEQFKIYTGIEAPIEIVDRTLRAFE